MSYHVSAYGQKKQEVEKQEVKKQEAQKWEPQQLEYVEPKNKRLHQ
jgi:hypothetical protein